MPRPGSARRPRVAPPRRRAFDRVVSEKIDLYTVLDGLRDAQNDYSTFARQFRAGDVRFIDLVDPLLRDLPRYRKYRQDRQSIFGDLLNDADADSLSIVIPVGFGRQGALRECLDSIVRQTFFINHPSKVELILIQDGVATSPEQNIFLDEFIDRLETFMHYKLFRLNPTPTAVSNRRATARNVGIMHTLHTIVFFVDSSMVLEQNFLAEQMLRHSRTTLGTIALVGFKQNIKPGKYREIRAQVRDGTRVPKYKQDWKWRRGYMQRSDHLNGLGGNDTVGRRPLPRFFHTGLTSARLDRVKEVGGFHPSFDAYWGLEDTFLGALLLARGTKIVPCPSSVAFMIQHRESNRWKEEFDIPRNLSQYKRRLATALRGFTFDSLRRQIRSLRDAGTLECIKMKG